MTDTSTIDFVALDLYVIYYTQEGKAPLSGASWECCDKATQGAFRRLARYVIRLGEIQVRKGIEYGVKEAWVGITTCGLSGVTQSKLIEKALEHWKEKNSGEEKTSRQTSATRPAVNPPGDLPPAVGP